MKINCVSFSDFNSEIEVYDLNKMDLFVYLLAEIIKKGSDKTIKEVLLDLDISKALLYLYQNNFYYLLDNNLINNNSDSDDISEVKVNEVSFSDFGKYCLSINSIPLLNEVVEKRVIYNPVSKELVSDNIVTNSSNVVVIPSRIDYLELINERKKELINRYDNFVLNYKRIEASPYYFSVNKVTNEIKEYLNLNKSEIKDDKLVDESKCEFLSNNFKINLFYGKENLLVNSEYYLIYDKDKEFTVSDNKVYVGKLFDEIDEYSFVSFEDKMYGYKVGNVSIDGDDYSVIERDTIKNYSSEVKKYLVKNKNKFKDLRIVEKIIDLL